VPHCVLGNDLAEGLICSSLRHAKHVGLVESMLFMGCWACCGSRLAQLSRAAILHLERTSVAEVTALRDWLK